MEKFRKIGITFIIWLIGFFLMFVGFMKLTGMGPMQEGMVDMGYTGFLLYLVGAVDFFGGLGLLIPRTRGFAAVGIILLMMGAIASHIVSQHPSSSLTLAFVVTLCCVLILVVDRPFIVKLRNRS